MGLAVRSPHPPCRAPSPIAAQREKGLVAIESLLPSEGWEKVADRADEGAVHGRGVADVS